MSSNFVTPGQDNLHTLNPLYGWHPDWSVTIRGRLSETVTIVAHSGMVVHAAATLIAIPGPFAASGRGPQQSTLSMGCGAARKGPPLWLWPGAYDPDISNKGTPSGVPAVGDSIYGSPDWVSAIPGRSPDKADALFGLSGLMAMVVETTEYDVDQTYVPGEHLRAVTSDTNTNGGRVTNQNASGGAPFGTTSNVFSLLTDTVIGIVHTGEYKNANNRNVLSLHTYFLPGTR